MYVVCDTVRQALEAELVQMAGAMEASMLEKCTGDRALQIDNQCLLKEQVRDL